MAYVKPELLVIGSASAIVLGGLPNTPTDHGNVDTSTTIGDLVAGLDD